MYYKIKKLVARISQTVLNKIGMDGAIFYTSLAKTIAALSGIITIFFIAKFLSGIEQGFYYTFGSILSIQLFFELGLNGIITQYAAHEFSHLSWDSKTKLSGSQVHLSRLSSLLHFAVKWYPLIAVALFTILLIVGVFFFKSFDQSGGSVDWILPWLILSFSTSIAFLINPILAFMEGLGKVKHIAQIRLIQQLVTAIMIWTTLIFKAKLYSIGISSIIGLLVVFLLLYFSTYKKLLLHIWKSLGKEVVHYRKEIFPYQWKIALSWVSGYFIFQLFNPVLFATSGAIVAGQMGMTIVVLNGIFGLSFSWISTKIPLFSGLIALKDYVKLDRIFDKTLRQSVFINVLGLSVLFISIYTLRYFRIPLADRLLPYFPLILMMIPVLLNQFISSWATYLRCHKEEPFLIPSIVGAIAMTLSTLILGNYFGVVGMAMGYCVLTLFVGFFWGLYIFKTKKREWHE